MNIGVVSGLDALEQATTLNTREPGSYEYACATTKYEQCPSGHRQDKATRQGGQGFLGCSMWTQPEFIAAHDWDQTYVDGSHGRGERSTDSTAIDLLEVIARLR